MKFNTKYGTKNKVSSECGSPEKIEYEYYVDDFGREELKEVGKTDFQAFIESHADSVDFQKIIARYQSGDVDALEKVKGFYADVSGLNLNLSDVMNLNYKGQKLFDSLPVEVKEVYNNNYLDFVSNPEKLVEAFKKDKKDKQDDKAEEVVKSNDEQEQ